MGQKVNPISFRLQVHKNWELSLVRWQKRFCQVAGGRYQDSRTDRKEVCISSNYQRIEIERSANLITVTIHTAKAGVVIGRGGAGVTELKKDIEKIASLPVRINIEEVKRPELSCQAGSREHCSSARAPRNFRRATKMAAQNTMNAGAKGIRIEVAGRLNNAEMARREKVIEGSVPLHTLRADIDFHTARARSRVWYHRCEGLDLQGRKE
jgi:small subunit ribosomal protein S3